MPETTAQRKLYALLVGIDTYKSIRGLKGCVQDVNSMKDYLSQLSGFDPHIQTLTSPGSQLPSKENIIKGFEEHLSQAGQGDVVLFYFAGHGVREVTHIPAFKRVEPDNCMETLVCYDSRVQSGPGMEGTMLSDKEIGYLLYHHIQHEQAHVVVITDCCHSGGNTRSVGNHPVRMGSDPDEELSSRLVRPKPIPARRYDGFLFHQEIPLEILEPEHALLDEIIPQAQHIQMAACRDVEEAWEARRPNGTVGGFFTITLLDILNSSSEGISYYELKERATNLMRNMKKRPQTPQVYTSGKNPNELYRYFLNGTPGERPTYCTVTYNTSEGWTLNLGAIHGIPGNTEKEPISIEVTDKEGEKYVAKSLKVFPGSTQIKFVGGAPKKSEVGLRGKIEGIGTYPLKVFLTGDQEGIESFLTIFQQNSTEGQNIALELVKKEEDAQYVMRAQQGRLTLCYPFEERPLIEPAWGYELDWASVMYDYLIHISQWTFFNKLNHPNTRLHDKAPSHIKMYPVELQIFQKLRNGEEQELTIRKERLEIELDSLSAQDEPCTYLRIKLTNHSDQELYCVLLYMNMLFTSNPAMLPSNGVWLEPGASIEAANGEYIEVKQHAYVEFFNWDYFLDTLKLLVSTEQFDPLMLFLPELPKPPMSPFRDPQARSWGIPDPGKRAPQKDWTSFQVEVYSRRP